MFKYKYLKRLFCEAIILSCICFAALFLAVYVHLNNSTLIAFLACLGILTAALAVFSVLYSRLYFKLEIIMDAAQQRFVLLRPKRNSYYVYGSPTFISKFSDVLPQRPEITANEFSAFVGKLSEISEEQAGELFYRYTGDDGEDIWVRMKRVPYGGKTATLVIDVTDLYLQQIYLIQSDYYDSSSRLLNREAVLKRVQRFIDNGCKEGHYAIISVNGFERAAGNNADTNSVIKTLGERFKDIESKRIITGKNSHNSFLFFFAGEFPDIKERLDGLVKTAYEVLSEGNSANRLSVSCGYCRFPDGADNLDDLVSRTDFALYQAMGSNSREPVMFSPQRYADLQEEFRKAKAVHDVIETNSVDYYFQPIVNARTGRIFAYEALMRPVSEIKLTPLDVLSVAAKDNCLVSVERMTLSNVMRLVAENESKITGKKVFINTIPNMLLPQEEFESLCENYGRLFENTVIEITEDANFNDDLFKEFNDRCERLGCTIALDDFGTGYSNESNLLKIQPAFIKLDRSLITNINADEQKRTLVAGLVNFAKRHNIRVIAEGVETRPELEYAISIDVDYIQGYYTARPQPAFIDKISQDVSDIIVAANLKRAGRNENSIYETTAPGAVDIIELALNGYSELVVKHSPVEINGDASKTVEMCISVQEDLNADIILNNCALFRHPYVFECGENSKVNVEMRGMNKFFGGFSVPTSAELSVTGDGSCDMEIHTNDPVAFGSSSESGFGKINFGLQGKCSIVMIGETVIGFGGKYSSIHSEIAITGADIEIEQRGVRPIAIGAVSGSSMLSITDSTIVIKNDGDKVLGIGNISGTIDAELSASSISVKLGGDKATAFGILKGGSGSVNITDGCKLKIEERAKSIIGVGARDGEFEIYCYDSLIDVFAEGNEAVAIGDIEGETSVYIKSGSIVDLHVASVSPRGIFTERGQVFIDSGNIISDVYINSAMNSRGEELEYHKLRASEDVFFDNYDNGDSGCYIAPVYDKCPDYVGVYLPHGFLPPDARLYD